jgi:hypothetical protein
MALGSILDSNSCLGLHLDWHDLHPFHPPPDLPSNFSNPQLLYRSSWYCDSLCTYPLVVSTLYWRRV